MQIPEDPNRQIKQAVRAGYGQAALRVLDGGRGCCGNADGRNAVCNDLYDACQAAAVPPEALVASFGCGNPTALAELRPGEVVLDLGCGAGLDVLLAAQQVGVQGKVYGLDMTEEMLALARTNQRKAGITNALFLRGEMEHIPLRDGSVDVVISNCVINLAPQKDRVLGEALRVLRPGGRLAIADIVVRGEPPAELRRNVGLWIGCMAGALEENEYRRKLEAAGFEGIEILPLRVYRAEDLREFVEVADLEAHVSASQLDERFFSAFIRAHKPAHGVGCHVTA